MTKIVGIIQVRMGSSRLPGKVMLPILGKPVLWHIYNRLKNCKNLDGICIATSTNPLDDEIEKFARKKNIQVFRGPEEKIVDRLLGAAKKFQADAIVRILGDCPLTDPTIVDAIVEIYKRKKNVDFASNVRERTFPDGLDVTVISTALLEKLSLELGNSQEWFQMHIIENCNKYTCVDYKNKEDLSKLKWSLDYQEDYEFVKAVYQNLFTESAIFLMHDVLELLRNNPSVAKINEKYPADTGSKYYELKKLGKL